MRYALLRHFPRIAPSVLRASSNSRVSPRPLLPRFLSTSPSPNSQSSNPAAAAPPPPAPSSPPTSTPDPPSSSSPTPQILTTDQSVETANLDLSQTAELVSAAAAGADPHTFSDTLLQPALYLLNSVHDISGLPWYLSIALSTLVIRSALLPVTLMTMRNSARMAALKTDISERRDSVVQAVRTGNRALATKLQEDMQSFMRNAGVAPMKVLAGPLAQFPVFISFFVGLRRLSQADPSFATGGTAWFVDLAVRDPTFALPIVCGASLLAMTELGGDTGSTAMTSQMRMVMRGVAALSVPMTYWFPAAVFCYWIPNNIFSMALGAGIRQEKVKRILGLHVDLSKIPGTRAEREARAKAATGKGRRSAEVVDHAMAIASYGKVTGSDVLQATPSGKVVKPVLLKQRPVKKKIKSSQ